MSTTLNEVANNIRTLAGDNMGLDLSEIIGTSLEDSSSIRDIRRKADAVQGTTEVMQKVMEQKLGGLDSHTMTKVCEVSAQLQSLYPHLAKLTHTSINICGWSFDAVRVHLCAHL